MTSTNSDRPYLGKGVLIAPSLLSADFTRLAEQIAGLVSAGADLFHLDVMDGHFVPNLTFGPPVISHIRRNFPRAFLDVHLMISNAEETLQQYIDAGANAITVHAEAIENPKKVIDTIKDAGIMAGIALNPETPISRLDSIIDILDLVLIMSVNPGFGGQSFIPNSVAKVASLNERAPNTLIAVDGGVNTVNAPDLIQAGARLLVSGSTIFCSTNPAQTITQMRCKA